MDEVRLSGSSFAEKPIKLEQSLSTEGLAQQLMIAYMANHELPTEKYARDIALVCWEMARQSHWVARER